LRGLKSDDGAARREDDRVVRRIFTRVTRQLPPNATAALALAGIFVVVSGLAAIAPRRMPVDRSAALAAVTAAPTATPTSTPMPALRASPALDDAARLPPLLPGIDRPTPPPRPTPEPAPVALGTAPAAGGILFRACERLCTTPGIWRYDGGYGTLTRVGEWGEPTSNGRGYVVRRDDGQFTYVASASGVQANIAPVGATAADALITEDGRFVTAYVDGATSFTTGNRTFVVTRDLSVTSLRLSTDARRLALLVTLPGARAFSATEIWVADLPGGSPRRLLHADLVNMGPVLQVGPWSPDGTLLAYWEISISGSMNADGVRLRVVDVRSGATHDLGTTLYGASRLSWKAPHTLAYVSGGSRMTWDHKAVRIWSPESGFTNVTTSGIGLNPSWSADGTKLYLIAADEYPYVPVDYFAGRDSGARRLSVYDVATKRITMLASPRAYVYEGVRQSRDGTQLLVMWRPTYDVRMLQDLPAITMTLGLFDPATGRATPLVRIAGDVGFGYYGGYDGPEGMVWSEGR
jgi:hypothetical protein